MQFFNNGTKVTDLSEEDKLLMNGISVHLGLMPGEVKSLSKGRLLYFDKSYYGINWNIPYATPCLLVEFSGQKDKQVLFPFRVTTRQNRTRNLFQVDRGAGDGTAPSIMYTDNGQDFLDKISIYKITGPIGNVFQLPGKDEIKIFVVDEAEHLVELSKELAENAKYHYYLPLKSDYQKSKAPVSLFIVANAKDFMEHVDILSGDLIVVHSLFDMYRLKENGQCTTILEHTFILSEKRHLDSDYIIPGQEMVEILRKYNNSIKSNKGAIK